MKILYIVVLCYTLLWSSDSGKLIRVVDGDTIKLITTKDAIRSYRLAGIDTPESYYNKKAKADIKSCNILDYKYLHLGLIAKEYLQDHHLVNDKFTYDTHGYGRYGRPIIYIEGVNDVIIKLGLGVVKDYGNLSKDRLNYLYDLETKAMQEKIGIWRYLKKKCY